jgi:hypothetical protein
MYGIEHGGQRLLGSHQVPQVGSAVALAHPAAALWVRRPCILGEAAIFDVQAAF